MQFSSAAAVPLPVIRRKSLWLVVAALAIAYLIYPYVTLYRLDRALEARDAATISELIDWPVFRQQLKTDIGSSLVTRGHEGNGIETLGAALGMALSPYVLDPLAEAVLSPSGLITWYSEARQSGQSSTLIEAISYAFFSAPTRFDVSLRTNEPQYPTLRFEMRLEGVRWRVSRLLL